jgi:hypothetical protein
MRIKLSELKRMIKEEVDETSKIQDIAEEIAEAIANAMMTAHSEHIGKRNVQDIIEKKLLSLVLRQRIVIGKM